MSAVIEEDDEATVYIVEDGEVTRRIIEIGIQSNDLVEVLGGLDGYEEIVIVGQSGLRDGSKVLASNTLRDTYTG